MSRSLLRLGLSLGTGTLLGAGALCVTGEQEPQEGSGAPILHNPYFDHTQWKVWRDDPSPVEGVTSVVREENEDKPVEVTLVAPPQAERLYPAQPPAQDSGEPFVVFEKLARPSTTYAGMWDDVYSSWSGTHGYIRTRWMGDDGSSAVVRGHMIDFVDAKHENMLRAGVNFVHQSTTGMGHGITNGDFFGRPREFERLYFADLLVTAPAHASFTDHRADYSTDLYTAHVPTLFNSVGSSNSETMAITKMVIAGGYLPPKTKLLLKRNGLYPAALLYLWKSALPFDLPFDHEMRQRIAYKAVGNRHSYPESYGAAGIDRGDMSLAYHQYDDEAHMRAMIEGARSMDVALPEAIFDVTQVKGGEEVYLLNKSALVLQQPGETIELTVDTGRCYDLQGLPLTTRWKLLYGNKHVGVEPAQAEAVEAGGYPTLWTITIPWDDALPGGRTAIALTANNGRFDSNPAILTVFRKKGDLPPPGMTPGEYAFPAASINQRPVILGLQDQVAKRGRALELTLVAVDPEGFPVSFYKRSGDVGRIEGDLLSWDCPRKVEPGPKTVAIIASDGTSGNSYGGEALTVHVDKPSLMARITIDRLIGPAPMTVKLSAKDSIGPRSKLKYGWDFYTPTLKRTAQAFESLEPSRDVEHTFEDPGVHEIALHVRHGGETDSETIRVFVTALPGDPESASLQLEGNGVVVGDGDGTPSTFDHTDFGGVTLRSQVVHTFRMVNTGDENLTLSGKNTFNVTGEHADDFRIVRRPRNRIAAGGCTTFELRFAPKGMGLRTATLEIRSNSDSMTFSVAGLGQGR